MTTIKEDISKRIPAKHIFFVMDACYSGLLVATRGAEQKSGRDFSYLQEITKEQARQVLTAGSKDQEVLDGGPKGHSVFTGRFIELLENTEDFITANEISMLVKEKVFSNAKARNHTQTPDSGRLFGLGDFVFVPSLEQKVEDTKTKITEMEQEVKRLEELAKAAQQSDDERSKRRVEQEKNVIQAKLKAEQLRHQALEDDRRKREQAEQERLKRERELAEAKKVEGVRLAALTETVKEKRKAMEDVSLSALSPETTITEMRETDKKIKEIKENFRKELAEGINRIATRVNDKFVKLAQAKQDEFETADELKNRIEREKKEAEKEQTNEIVDLERKIESEYNSQVAPFIENLKKLSGNEFTLTTENLILELGGYDATSNTYPVTIKAKQPLKGILVAANANIPLPREDARVFKQHFENNMLRPEMSGNFESTEFFRIAKAYVVDDATNKQYDLFTSKFVDLGNGIVYDTVTKLLWLKNANHFGKRMYFNYAQKACENLTVAGISGWRLPKSKELTRMYTVYWKQEPHPFSYVADDYCYWASSNKCEAWSRESSACVSLNDRSEIKCCGTDVWVWPVRGNEWDGKGLGMY
ncbi:MAG: DUF1566 domain-containing protein [Candidatus Schekmanbacteria bacterium]|nr:DUF1566 domain-containing protein [Candidatus Schekmanbacteria bacterium]